MKTLAEDLAVLNHSIEESKRRIEVALGGDARRLVAGFELAAAQIQPSPFARLAARWRHLRIVWDLWRRP